LIAIVSASVSSGFAGVYFEKILKGAKTSLWLKNIQLALYGILIAGITLYQSDAVVRQYGFFYGWTQFV
jgi:UDP-sugar transporter A1/2/3